MLSAKISNAKFNTLLWNSFINFTQVYFILFKIYIEIQL